MINRKSAKERFYQRVQKTNYCWIWEGYKSPAGYGVVTIYGEQHQTHRLSWMFECGPIPKGMIIMHTCDNPSCVNPDHLKLGTQRDNMHDMWDKGRGNPGHLCGEESPPSKLTDVDVIKIRLSNELIKVLAKKFGVSTSTVCDIQKGRIWKHLPYDETRAGVNKLHKLTTEDVMAIRNSKESSKSLALKYGVTTRSISDVCYGHTWKDVEGFQEVAEIAPSNVKKLTEDGVRFIRSSVETNISLSKKFSVSQQTICDIKKRRSWKHI